MQHSTQQSAYAYTVSLHSQMAREYYNLALDRRITPPIKRAKEESDKIWNEAILAFKSPTPEQVLVRLASRMEVLQKIIHGEVLQNQTTLGRA